MKKSYQFIFFLACIVISCKKPSTPQPITVTPQMYTITASAGANGTVSPDTITVVSGKNAAFTFSPATGFHTDSLWVDGVFTQSLAGAGSYTLSNVTANHTVKVSFTDALTKPQLDSLSAHLNGS